MAFLIGAYRNAGKAKNLECSVNALPVVRMDAGGRIRIDPGKLFMERAKTGRLLFHDKIFLDPGVGRRARTDPAREDLHVETRSTDDQRHIAPGVDVIDDGTREIAVPGGIEGLVGVRDVDEMVGDGGTFRRGGFGGPYVHVPVDLHGIGVDDLARQPFGEFQG